MRRPWFRLKGLDPRGRTTVGGFWSAFAVIVFAWFVLRIAVTVTVVPLASGKVAGMTGIGSRRRSSWR